MRKTYITCIAVALLGLFACGTPSAVKMESVPTDLTPETSANLLEQVSGITLIPLETNDSLVIGGKNELLVEKGEYYVVNQKGNDRVFRFDGTGKFLNTIGTKGRGPGEYAGVVNAQISGDTVLIYSRPGMSVYAYTKDGAFLSFVNFEQNTGGWFYKVGGNYLVYNGYGMQAPERVYLFSPDKDTRIPFLKSEAKVLNISDELPALEPFGEDVLIRESYNDTIFRYQTGLQAVNPDFRFDFGKHAIDKKVFEFEDRMKSAEYLMSLKYASIRRYMESEPLRLVEVIVNKQPLPGMIYGLNRKGTKEWIWFSGGAVDTGAFATSFRTVSGNRLYCLIEPYRLKNLTSEEKSKITNPQVLDQLQETDNFVIGVVELK